MNEKLFPEEEIPNFQYSARIIGAGPKTILFGLHNILNQFEHHLENISTKYKYIALTWLLASYTGIGSLMSADMGGLLFNHFLAIAIVSFIGVIGISLIWHLDINIYHRFRSAILIEEVIMEEQYSFLLQSRRKALKIEENKEGAFSQCLLYLISNSLLIITMGVSIIFITNNNILNTVLIFGSSLTLIAIMWIFTLNFSNKYEKIICNSISNRRLQLKKLLNQGKTGSRAFDCFYN